MHPPTTNSVSKSATHMVIGAFSLGARHLCPVGVEGRAKFVILRRGLPSSY